MKKRSDKIQWGRVFRRSAALFMATVAVWALLTLGGAGAATDAFHALGEDPDFISSLLRTELGDVARPMGPLSVMDGWSRLALGQSALLRSNEKAVAARLLKGRVCPA